MKIDIRSVVVDHILTLRNAESGRLSIIDITVFYGIPILFGVLFYLFDTKLKSVDVYNVSITFFGIFIALLLNLQVAIFSILQRKWVNPKDDRIKDLHDESIKTRRILLGELNANLSYLILVCCFALIVSISLFVFGLLRGTGPSLLLGIYVHFILNLLMIVKRAHLLFQTEYRANSAP